MSTSQSPTDKEQLSPLVAVIPADLSSPRQYRFTNCWFEGQKPILNRIFDQIQSHQRQMTGTTGPIAILEIGAHEGRSTCHHLDNFLEHPGSSILTVDPYDSSDVTSPVSNTTFELFKYNTGRSKYPHKLIFHRDYSNNVLSRLIADNSTGTNKKLFDLITIDGSHLAKDVLIDACLAFSLVKVPGFMFFDDYLGGSEDRDTNLGWPKIGIDCFLKTFADRLVMIHSGYHIGVMKIRD